MQPDHTVSDFAGQEPVLPVPALVQAVTITTDDVAGHAEDESAAPVGALRVMTYCFAWLFGLEPFLTGGDRPRR